MSDYSYYVVVTPPPRPRMTWQRWVRSYFKPFEVWTRGTGEGMHYPSGKWGPQVGRRCWRFNKGQVRPVGIDHTGCKPGGDFQGRTCRCLSDEADR